MTWMILAPLWESEELYWQDDTWDETIHYEQEPEASNDDEYEEVYATWMRGVVLLIFEL